MAEIIGYSLLKEIRDGKLYKAEYGTFEEYVRVRWKMERAHAYRLMALCELGELLSPMGDILPANERVSRELLHLKKEPELITQAWQEAVDTAPVENGEAIVTSKHVKLIVDRYRHPERGDAPSLPEGEYDLIYCDPPFSRL